MDNLTNNIDPQKEGLTPETVVWPTKKPGIKKKYLVAGIFAALLVLVVAIGSFYFVRNLNMASTPNSPASRPEAKWSPKGEGAGSNQKTQNTIDEGCKQGCGSNEYCDGTRCKKTGGVDDGRTELQQQQQSIPIATPTEKPQQSTIGYEVIPGYRCTASNCPSPQFRCRGENICENVDKPGLTVANDILNCGGTGKICMNVGEACIGGQCIKPDNYECKSSTCDYSKGFKCLPGEGKGGQCVLNSVTSVTPTVVRPVVTQFVGDNRDLANLALQTDPNNCGGNGPCSESQTCVKGACKIKTTISGADMCADVKPYNQDGAARTRECCVKDIGVIPIGAAGDNWKGNNGTSGTFTLSDEGKVDFSWHWTNCSPGTSCRQGVGCIGSGTKTPELSSTDTTTTTTVTIPPTITTTVTVPPTTTVTVPPTITTTIPPTITATPTGTVTVTVTPTIAVCNESCSEDDDCADGLFCDSESNKCRKPECSDEKDCSCPVVTPEPTIVDCNYKCNSDDNCSSGLICDSDSGRCRKAACSDEKDCSCPKPRKTDAPTREITTRRTTTRTAAQPTVLKEAGILDFPGVAVFGSGLLLTVIGILLAL